METHASVNSLSHIESSAREQAFVHWLRQDCGLANSSFTVLAMAGDASFRRYFRIHTPHTSYVAMDADPERENCHAFIAMADHLRGLGLYTPQVLHRDLTQGFLLLSDFGHATYLKTLTQHNVDHLYRLAIDALIILQQLPKDQHRQFILPTVSEWTLPHFSREWLLQEFDWHREWFLQKLLKLNLDAATDLKLSRCFAILIDSALQQPQVLMHRDYHSANLMVLENDKVGILDFQDAFIGPCTYDLVSMLRDCYIMWPNDRVRELALYYLAQRQTSEDLPILKQVDEATFLRWFDLMGIQRHLKAVFNFARKYVRDGQAQYLNHIPRTLNYVISVSQHYPELSFLHDYLHTNVMPAWEKLCVR